MTIPIYWSQMLAKTQTATNNIIIIPYARKTKHSYTERYLLGIRPWVAHVTHVHQVRSVSFQKIINVKQMNCQSSYPT